MIFRKIAIVIVFFLMTSWSQSLCNLKVSVYGLGSDNGKLFVGLFNKKDDFLKIIYKGEIVEIKNGKAIVEFKQIPKGIYAVSTFHDENDNGELDKNFFGIPKEPFSFSNNAKGVFGPPKFSVAKFTLENSDSTIKITF